MSLGNDFRYALRMMRQRPGFSALAVVIVALEVGANSAVFSLVDAVLLSPLPFPEAQGNVVGRVMKRAVAIIGAGLAVGLVASFGATRFAAALLYQVDPLDAGTFVVVAAGMTGVVLLASYLPARRAADADPVAALRQ